MARLNRGLPTGPSHRVVLIDDDADLLEATRQLLALDGHEILTASDPEAGIALIREHRPQLVLLDYFMPRLTGADVVRRIREFDQMVQVLLVTGYAEEQPGRKLLRELDIQGYHDKGDGPERLLVLVDAALKHFRALAGIERQRRRLVHLVESGPAVAKLQPADVLFKIALTNLSGMLDAAGDSLVATSNNGLFVMRSAQEGISVRAGTGKFEGLVSLTQLAPGVVAAVRAGLDVASPEVVAGRHIAVPLRTRDGDRGCMIVESANVDADCAHLCQIYGRQVVQALENLLLYEQATHDSLCRIWNRTFGRERLNEALRLAHRMHQPTSVAMIDLDRFKAVNDTWGHAAGDLTLVRVAQSLRDACRTTDIACRHGGEEFLMILPGTDEAGARVIAERVRQRIADTPVVFEGTRLPVTASLGVATALAGPWTPTCAAELVHRADQAMYDAKRTGRNRVCAAVSLRAVA